MFWIPQHEHFYFVDIDADVMVRVLTHAHGGGVNVDIISIPAQNTTTTNIWERKKNFQMALPKCSLSLTTNMIMNVTSFPEFENDELGCTESFPSLGPICPSFPTISQNIQHELDIASKQLRLSFINSKRCEFQYMKKLFKPNLNLKSPGESTPKSTKINNSISKRKAEEKFICPVGFFWDWTWVLMFLIRPTFWVSLHTRSFHLSKHYRAFFKKN